MSSNIKVYKKGDFLFREGDRIQTFQMIQSGGVSVCFLRGKKTIDIAQLGANQVLGEGVLFGNAQHFTSAIATAETKVVEVPLEVLKQSFEASSQMMKFTLKSLVDRIKLALSDIKSSKLERGDASPCPEDQVAKIFGSVFHVANHKGERDPKDKNKASLDWTLMKQYAQRVFGESPKRLEQTVQLLSKINLANVEMGKPPESPEGPDEIQKVTILNLSAIESFFEFFQYYYFKGSKKELLKFEEILFHILNHFMKLTETQEPDRFGVVSVEFGKATESFKNELSINFNTTLFNRLEQKGIFLKRNPQKDGSVLIQFERKEFQTQLFIWRILREIEKWNELGFIDMADVDWLKPKKKSDGAGCPQCGLPVPPQAKFCSECGAKLESAA